MRTLALVVIVSLADPLLAQAQYGPAYGPTSGAAFAPHCGVAAPNCGVGFEPGCGVAHQPSCGVGYGPACGVDYRRGPACGCEGHPGCRVCAKPCPPPVEQPMQAPQPLGQFISPPPTGAVMGESTSTGVSGLAIHIPAMSLRMPTLQMPSFFRIRQDARMMIDSAQAPYTTQAPTYAPAAALPAMMMPMMQPQEPAAQPRPDVPAAAPRHAPQAKPPCPPQHHMRPSCDALPGDALSLELWRQLQQRDRQVQQLENQLARMEAAMGNLERRLHQEPVQANAPPSALVGTTPPASASPATRSYLVAPVIYQEPSSLALPAMPLRRLPAK